MRTPTGALEVRGATTHNLHDVDVILVMPEGWDMTRTGFKDFEYNVFDREQTKRAYKIEVFPVLPGSDQYRYFFDLFTRVRIEWCRQFSLPDDVRKGLLRVKP